MQRVQDDKPTAAAAGVGSLCSRIEATISARSTSSRQRSTRKPSWKTRLRFLQHVLFRASQRGARGGLRQQCLEDRIEGDRKRHVGHEGRTQPELRGREPV
ncbi:MAG: hypothetical protein HYY06_31470 [Deltaproteobacteria bacterium]|nr:hypothetical protein [Deltaproteobacteria bacterium]